ncbi:MAG: type II toxin-antitoxin system VapC family toxin [Verrucomicrobiota bacterium]
MRVFFDTSVLVAASIQKHPHFPRAFGAMKQVAQKRAQGFVSAHSLAETYSTLTALPLAPRIHPMEAKRIIVENILKYFRVISLSSRDYRSVISYLAQQGFTSGAIYDALLIRCAEKKSCAYVYTFNVEHFQRIAPALSEKIVAP